MGRGGKKGKGKVSSRLFLLAPVSLRSTDRKGLLAVYDGNEIDHELISMHTTSFKSRSGLYACIIGHPLGGTLGKGGDFVKDPVEVCNFPLLNGDKE